MITGIAFVEMRVRDFDECQDVYGRELGLTEVQDRRAEQTEHGEWESSGAQEAGSREAVLQVGDSFLILREDETVITQVLPNGDVDNKALGSVHHYSFYVESNHHAYSHWKDFFATYRYSRTKTGPQVQPMQHSYLQRSLLEFADPNGYTIQFSEIVDPRLSLQERRVEKANIANVSTGGPVKGFDHLNMHCPDLAVAKELYADKLGLRTIDHSDGETTEGYVFVAGLCDLEVSAKKPGMEPDGLGPGIIASYGLWCDDVDAVARDVGHTGPITERDLALGVPMRSITVDVGDGVPVELAQRL